MVAYLLSVGLYFVAGGFSIPMENVTTSRKWSHKSFRWHINSLSHIFMSGRKWSHKSFRWHINSLSHIFMSGRKWSHKSFRWHINSLSHIFMSGRKWSHKSFRWHINSLSHIFMSGLYAHQISMHVMVHIGQQTLDVTLSTNLWAYLEKDIFTYMNMFWK